MAAVSQRLTTRSPFQPDQHPFSNGAVKRIPILSAAELSHGGGGGGGGGDPMDVSQPAPTPAPAANMGPPATNSPNTDRSPPDQQPHHQHHSPQTANSHEHNVNGGGGSQSLGVQAAAHQPKVVQTAFIHKLYK